MKKNYKLLSHSIRKKIIEESYIQKSAHLGSNLSSLEILIACFEQNKKEEIEIILSKGHAALSYYVILNHYGYLANYKGFTKSKNLWGHISKIKKNNFLKFGFGSLGYGLGIGAGLAISKKNKKVACILSDGELNEGSVWETLMFIKHHNLKNMIIFIDKNNIQSFGRTKDIINLGNLKKLFSNFELNIFNCDGHDVTQLLEIFKLKTKKPIMVICNTVKGKGIIRYENKVFSHYKPPLKDDLFK